MSKFYLYSNILGSYAFDQKSYMFDKVMFKESDIIRNSKLLEGGRFIEPEKQLIRKHKKAGFVFLGFKAEKFEDTAAEFDNDAFSRVSAQLEKDKGIFSRLKEANTMITRQKVKESVNENTLIVQAVSSIKELEKATNLVAKRLREWYSYYLPEFSETISDHEKFAEIIVAKDKKALLRDLRIAEEQSMGGSFGKEDIDQMLELAKSLSGMYGLRQRQELYLEKLMKGYCPNIQAVAGTLIGAKLLCKAGSLKRLVEFPSSTIQVLGAEEAFFRHMTTGAKMPRHGFISQHELVMGAPQKEHGKIARALANKISIAAKVDYFKGQFVGHKLKKGLYEKFKK